ncbi:MAG TPA: hypothetical protein ENI80_02230 [Acidiferrobacteraceae bacterium]|nr:hypothetical protein [Acidiferrobacteraceae bacterium]
MSKKKYILLALLSIAVLAVLVAGVMRWQLKQGRRTPPPPGESATLSDVVIASGLPRGFVVWSSNRHGNHDILKMDLPERRITRLTQHPHTEYFPRIAPNGKAIVFSRSQTPWVSQRNPVPWDVILLDLDNGKERLLAKNGNTPTWSTDGAHVYFQRNSTQFVEINVKTGQERILYTSGTGDVRDGTVLQTPSYSAETGRVAVTLRGAQRTMGIMDLNGKFTPITDGCQLAWSKRGDYLYYIGYGGHMKNALYRYDPKKGKSRLWMDLPGKFSHEYFPKLSNNERYLVIGASSSGHEHDSADYEIFLWQLGTPAADATRLSFHTGNDNWPDVYIYPGRN